MNFAPRRDAKLVRFKRELKMAGYRDQIRNGFHVITAAFVADEILVPTSDQQARVRPTVKDEQLLPLNISRT